MEGLSSTHHRSTNTLSSQTTMQLKEKTEADEVYSRSQLASTSYAASSTFDEGITIDVRIEGKLVDLDALRSGVLTMGGLQLVCSTHLLFPQLTA